jgi:hypothetical protein
MSDNPFSSSLSSPYGDSGPLAPVPLELMAILQRCWDLTMANPGMVLGAVLLPLAPQVVFQVIQQVLPLLAGDDEVAVIVVTLFSLGLSFVNFALSLFLQMGVIRIFLNLVRGEPADLGQLLSGGPHLARAFFTTLLVGLLTMLGTMLFCIPGIIAGIGLQYALYFVVDRELGPVEAMTESWRVTDGYKLQLFLIGLGVGLAGLLITCLTFGVGYLLAVPVLSLVTAVTYHALLSHQTGDYRG